MTLPGTRRGQQPCEELSQGCLSSPSLSHGVSHEAGSQPPPQLGLSGGTFDLASCISLQLQALRSFSWSRGRQDDCARVLHPPRFAVIPWAWGCGKLDEKTETGHVKEGDFEAVGGDQGRVHWADP